MKTFILILVLGLASTSIFANQRSQPIQHLYLAQIDICAGQTKSNNWRFAAADSSGNRLVFGPYSCNNACTRARNTEAGKLKWIVIGECEDRRIAKIEEFNMSLISSVL